MDRGAPDRHGTIRTFVLDLCSALEPRRPARSPARLLVTDGPGYALRAQPDAVDAVRFERAVDRSRALPYTEAVPVLQTALGAWREPAYADFADEPWAALERTPNSPARGRAVGSGRAHTELAGPPVVLAAVGASRWPGRSIVVEQARCRLPPGRDLEVDQCGEHRDGYRDAGDDCRNDRVVRDDGSQ